MNKVGGDFIANGSTVNLDIGFVPDKFTAVSSLEDTNAVNYEWVKSRADTANDYGQYGMTRAAGGGALTKLASAAGGFASYDTVAIKAMMPAPNGAGEVAATIAADFVAGATQPTARTTAVVGTVVRPSTHNSFVYECTVSGGVYGTEPTTWGTVVGETTSDGTNTWICRTEKLKSIGAAGITIGASIMSDSDEWTWEAEQWGSAAPEKDAASYDPVGKHAND